MWKNKWNITQKIYNKKYTQNECSFSTTFFFELKPLVLELLTPSIEKNGILNEQLTEYNSISKSIDRT